MELYSSLNESHKDFIKEQKLFFTATAPETGRINLSPKGLDSFCVIDDHTAAYLDLTGSGNETASHIEENGRITIMFCSFTQKPLILRLYGRGEVIHKGNTEWDHWHSFFQSMVGERQIIVIHIDSVQDSCGYAVPFYEFKNERDTLTKWSLKKGDEGIDKYQHENNQVSLDGLKTKLFDD